MFGFFEDISNFFGAFLDFLGVVVDFVIMLINGLLQFIQMIPSALTMLTRSIGFVPTFLVGFAVASISISIILMIVGREGGA